MTLVLPKPGDLGLDWSGANLTPMQIKTEGAKFMIRYSAGIGNANANTQFKLCKPYEIASAEKAGVIFVANSEWYESRVTEGAVPPWWDHAQEPKGLEARLEESRHWVSLSTRDHRLRGLTGADIPYDHQDVIKAMIDAGRADGTADLAFWKSRGLNKGASIYVSWDAAPVKVKWLAVDGYLKAYNSALGGYYLVDAYAGTPYLVHAINAKIIQYGWRPNPESWSNDGLPYQPSTGTVAERAALLQEALAATPAHIYQTGNYWFSNTADENMILRLPLGSHQEAQVIPPPKPPAPTPTPTPTPTPALKEDLMFVRFPDDASNGNTSKQAVYAFTGDHLLWLTPTDYLALGKPTVKDIVPNTTSHIHRALIAPGTPDPRVAGTKTVGRVKATVEKSAATEPVAAPSKAAPRKYAPRKPKAAVAAPVVARKRPGRKPKATV